MSELETDPAPEEPASGRGSGASPEEAGVSSGVPVFSTPPTRTRERPDLDPATFAPPLRRLVASGPEYILALCIEVLGVLMGPASALVSLLLAVYFAVRDQDDSRLSFGKRLTHLRVVDDKTGALATPRQAVLRNSPFVLGFVLAVVPGVEVVGWGVLLLVALVEGLVALFDPAGRRLGDRLAGTRVVGVDAR